jgi:hypothetical protein
MNSWNLFESFQGAIRAGTINEASAGLREALATGPDVRTIRLSLDPTSEEVIPWLDSVRAAAPETRGMMVQRFFARIFIRAGYAVVVGKKLDIFARGPRRSLFVEVKSSLEGGRFGSTAEMAQLDGYLTASESRGAEIWLGTMGINKPMRLHGAFRAEMRIANIGLFDIRWVSPKDTLLPHIVSTLG